jgi:phospholipase A1
MKSWMGLLVAGVVVLSSEAAQAQDLTLKDSALEKRLAATKAEYDSKWLIQPYRPTYIIPVSYIDEPSLGTDPEVESSNEDLQNVEVKFQISLRLPVAQDLIYGNGELNFAYTQVSVWQAYNSDQSSPFRDTNYEPEMFMAFDTDYNVLGLHGRLINLGVVHQSNGRGNDVLSRSWNRVYANFILERGNFACSIKPWYRFPEDEEEDNNPEIEDYLGYGDLRLAYNMNGYVLAALLRNNLQIDENRGSAELDWSFPMGKNLKGFIQYFVGYGETLLTYNESNQRIGAGFLLADWL